MRNIAIKTVVNAAALWVAAAVISGIHFAGDGSFGSRVGTIVLVALVFGVVNALLKPLVKLLSLPFLIVTLGLFTFIVNAFMLQITEWVSKGLGLSFSIDRFFWDAVLGALVITVVSMVLNFVLPDNDEI